MNLDRLRDRFFKGMTRYQWVSTVGRGGMGVIFKAQDTDLDDVVAIKVLAPDLDSDDQELLARFKREIQLNRKIKHPNVARIHDFGTSGDYYYITMEFIPGTDLRTLIQREGKLSPDQAIAILRQIALGTDAAHKLGIIHRDLKSQNVMVEESGAVAILDFGLARGGKLQKNINLTIDSIMIGTPHYMPPEQALGKPTDARSDIYSIGVMAYEMLTGRVPFTGESPLVIAMKQVSDAVPEEPLLTSGIPPDLASIVMRAMAKDPAHRIPTAASLEAELGMVQLPLPATSPAAKSVPRTPVVPVAPAVTPTTPIASAFAPPEADPFPDPVVERRDSPVPQIHRLPRGEKPRPKPPTPVPAAPAPTLAAMPAPTPAPTPPPARVPSPSAPVAAPLAPPLPPPPAPPPPPRPLHWSGARPPAITRPPEVLIVEDHPDERRDIVEHLTRFGIKTHVAKDGRGALEMLLKQPVDLVLLDLTLPDMDGFDVTRVIKSQENSAQIPIVIMTNRLDRSRFAFGIQSGASDLLQKPLELESATLRIWNVLAHRGFVPPPELMTTGRYEAKRSSQDRQEAVS
jgi:serine/threonine-protein kinase